VLLVLAASVVVLTPLMLLLPLDRVVRDLRGPLLYYVWNLAVTAVVTTAAHLDGGAGSPLLVLHFLVLAFMAVAYPPAGVVLTGVLTTVTHTVLVAWPLDPSSLLVATVLGAVTLICTLTSATHWAAHDRQLLLLRTQEAPATTDPLTCVPNRRAFLERVAPTPWPGWAATSSPSWPTARCPTTTGRWPAAWGPPSPRRVPAAV
jgi:hypothetical protein